MTSMEMKVERSADCFLFAERQRWPTGAEFSDGT